MGNGSVLWRDRIERCSGMQSECALRDSLLMDWFHLDQCQKGEHRERTVTWSFAALHAQMNLD